MKYRGGIRSKKYGQEHKMKVDSCVALDYPFIIRSYRKVVPGKSLQIFFNLKIQKKHKEAKVVDL